MVLDGTSWQEYPVYTGSPPIFKAGINLFKVNIGSTTTMCEICSKIGVFIINFEKISHTILVYPMLILNK